MTEPGAARSPVGKSTDDGTNSADGRALRSATTFPGGRPLRIALVAGEHSGDHLGAALMGALQARVRQGRTPPLEFVGVAGDEMTAAGMTSLFPIEDVAVMGPLAIAAQLPKIIRRVYQTVDHIIASQPDVLVIIDSPEFTHPIAKRVRAKAPNIPIIDYVSPTVWAWRPGRARKMAAYIDHVLGLLPFEPQAHHDLGGPTCTYVGHPMAERTTEMQTVDTSPLKEQLQIRSGKPVLVVLPGSRASEVRRLMGPFAVTINKLLASGLDFETIVPALPHVRPLIDAELRKTGVPVYVVEGADFKQQAFRLATCALAASGTVSLELALTGTPMVIAYKVDPIAAQLRHVISAQSVVLPNLILGENVFPEFLQEDCTPDKLAEALKPLLRKEEPYRAQRAAHARVQERLRLADGQLPSDAAADVVESYLRKIAATAPTPRPTPPR